MVNNVSNLTTLSLADLQGEDGADGADGTDGRDGVDGIQGPPGPAGQPGYVNVTYTETIADEFPVFSVKYLSSSWVLTNLNDRLEDITTSIGYMPLGGLSGDSQDSVAYPIHHSSASSFIPAQSSSGQTLLSSVDIPNYVEIPFHTSRIISDISWSCPSGIAARCVLVGKPPTGSYYWTKYYQIQGEKIFEEYPSDRSLITSERMNPSSSYTYSIPLANSSMP